MYTQQVYNMFIYINTYRTSIDVIHTVCIISKHVIYTVCIISIYLIHTAVCTCMNR